MQRAEGNWPPLNRQKAAKAPRKQGSQLLSRTEGTQHGFTTAEMPETTPWPSPGLARRTCLQMSSQNQPLQKHAPHHSSTRKTWNHRAQGGSPESRNKTTVSHQKLSYSCAPAFMGRGKQRWRHFASRSIAPTWVTQLQAITSLHSPWGFAA